MTFSAISEQVMRESNNIQSIGQLRSTGSFKDNQYSDKDWLALENNTNIA